MEALGAFSDGEWDSFTAIFSGEELHTEPHSFNHCSFVTDSEAINGGSEADKNSWFYSLDAFDPNMSCSSCSTDSSCSVANPSDFENYCFSGGHFQMENCGFGSFFNDVLMEEKGVCENGNVEDDYMEIAASAMAANELPLKRKLDVLQSETMADAIIKPVSGDDNKKKTRVSGDVQKKNRTSARKKTQKSGSKVEEEGNAAACDGPSSVSYCSEDDNGSEETNGSDQSKQITATRKTRASRGSATDPQSLYARKRRERINERLRTLQKLVPNGTKVDISTMLEEAVQYVKFLQLQIKLLSSDEMWMYAPLAYNGMDIGLHQKLSPFASH